MDPIRISELLLPFLEPASLSENQLSDISMYIDVLIRWNARVNLTAIRDKESIVTRHFGESLFAARIAGSRPARRLVDLGSGAGFPGLPIKIWIPDLHITVIESNNKKATFLREVIRALGLTNIDVFARRAEDFPAASADLVTLRAVERFESVLPIADRLLAPGGRLFLLIGRDQVPQAMKGLKCAWDEPIPIPRSTHRIILAGTKYLEPNQ